MPIRMREVKDNNKICSCCGTKFINTRNMNEIGFQMQKETVIVCLCKKCLDELFTKILKSTCEYNGKVKTKQDMERIKRENTIELKMEEKSVTETKAVIPKKRTIDDEWEDVLKEEINVKKRRRRK